MIFSVDAWELPPRPGDSSTMTTTTSEASEARPGWERWAWLMVTEAEKRGAYDASVMWQTLHDIDRAASADALDGTLPATTRARMGRLAVRARYLAHGRRSPRGFESD